MITRDTIVETEEGKTAPARKVKGLTFLATAQPESPIAEEIYGLASSVELSSSTASVSEVSENPFVTALPVSDNPFAAVPSASENPFTVSVPQVSPMVPTASPSDIADEIRKMKSLLDEGLISQEEFDAFKKTHLGI